MLCKACSVDIPDESQFCPKCGAQLNDDQPDSPDPKAVMIQRAKNASVSGDDVDDETDLWTGGYSAKAMVGAWVFGALSTVLGLVAAVMFPVALIPMIFAVLLLWIILGLILGYQKLSVHYTLSSQRFVHRSGILLRTTDRIEVIDIDDVTFTQGLVQRMLGVGTIKINSSDRTHPELFLHGIDDVLRVADLMDDARHRERRRRGLHIEAI